MRIALVTGANRGLGFETSRQLGKLGYHVILTSRRPTEGEEATAKLEQEGCKVSFHPLDVAAGNDYVPLFTWIEKEVGRLDVLVNNAGVFLDSKAGEFNPTSALTISPELILRTFEINTLSAYRMCQTFFPLMQKNGYGRVVNVSSGMGQLSEMEGGWPAYRISKTALNAVTKLFAAETWNQDILVNSVCPGWVRTDMGGQSAQRSPEQGADTIVWAATLPKGGPNGSFFRDRKPIPW